MMNISNADRAMVLVEALPYIRKYTDKIIVIKYGGSSMIAFTILLFIAIRLDASPTRGLEALN